jgi:tetratricopeptide (TPR) repeat protein
MGLSSDRYQDRSMFMPRGFRAPCLLALLAIAFSPAPAGHARAATDIGGVTAQSAARRAAEHFLAPGTDGAFLVARFAANQGDLDYAADQFLHALVAQPDDQELLQQTFLACLLTERPEAQHLAHQLSGYLPAQLFLLDLEAKSGNWDAALARLRGLPADGPGQILLPLLTAWLQLGAGRVDAALATLRPLQADNQRLHTLYSLHGAMIADLGGRPGDAGRLYRAALADPSALNLRLAQIVASWESRTGKQADAERILAGLGAADGELAIAIPALTEAAGARPIGRPTDGIAEAYLALAASVRQQDSADFAVVLLRLALDLRADLTAARLLLADIDEGAKRPTMALQALASTAAGDPLISLVRLRRAALTEQAGSTEQAVEQLEAIARDYPNNPEPYTFLGDLLRNKNRDGDAVEAYDKAIARVGTPQRRDWALFYARGIALERSHHWPRAQADFERALQLSPEQPYVLNYLGYSWTERGDNLDQAEQMIERAVAARPNDGAIVDSLGWVLLRQGDTAAAVKNLEHAVELQPDDPTINTHLGDAYWAAGRKLEARYQWERALTLNPEPEDIAKIEAKLHDATAPNSTAGSGPSSGAQHSVE